MTPIRTSACFCTYDVRAIVTPDLFDTVTYQHMARAFVAFCQAKKGADQPFLPFTIAAGYDARLHSPELFEALKNTLLDLGVNVIDLGLQPSPMVYASEWLDLPEGIQKPDATLTVTASHNPAPYNGLKWTLDGHALTREDVQDVKRLFEAQQKTTLEPVSPRGQVTTYSPIPDYLNWMQANFPKTAYPLKIVVDAGNATGGLVAVPLLDAFGIECVPLFTEVDGRFPNHHPDPSKAKNLADLIEAVQTHHADFGVAFDGDSDRLGVVDDQGQVIAGDFLLLLMTQAMMRRRRVKFPNEAPPKVVAEVKCSQHLFTGITEAGAEAIVSPTGHAKIKNTMKTQNAVLGGELSGHFFFKDEHWGFDDAFYGMMRMAQVLDDARQIASNPTLPLSSLVNSLPQTMISDELRYAVDAHLSPKVMSYLKDALQKRHEEKTLFGNQAILGLSTLDGIRLALDGGFVLVRASNTEPVLSLRWEARTEEDLDACETKLLYLIHKAVSHAEASTEGVS
ncbi:MAG: phosphomannomutase/phosphoglucomutase [Vampirovibrionales bacterium]